MILFTSQIFNTGKKIVRKVDNDISNIAYSFRFKDITIDVFRDSHIEYRFECPICQDEPILESSYFGKLYDCSLNEISWDKLSICQYCKEVENQ